MSCGINVFNQLLFFPLESECKLFIVLIEQRIVIYCQVSSILVIFLT